MTLEEAVKAVLAKWNKRALLFVGERDRLSTDEAEIYRDCINDLQAAINSTKKAATP
jgi:hypothetical protein